MMSISELISELRDSFRQRDFDRVEETLIFRETKLKAEIEDKKREIALLSEEVHFQRLEKMSVEMELKRFKELQDGGNIARAVAESGNARVSAAPGNDFGSVKETLDVREATNTAAIEDKMKEIRLLREKMVNREKYATAEVKDEKIDVLAEETKLASEPSKTAYLGSSGSMAGRRERLLKLSCDRKVNKRVVRPPQATRMGPPHSPGISQATRVDSPPSSGAASGGTPDVQEVEPHTDLIQRKRTRVESQPEVSEDSSAVRSFGLPPCFKEEGFFEEFPLSVNPYEAETIRRMNKESRRRHLAANMAGLVKMAEMAVVLSEEGEDPDRIKELEQEKAALTSSSRKLKAALERSEEMFREQAALLAAETEMLTLEKENSGKLAERELLRADRERLKIDIGRHAREIEDLKAAMLPVEDEPEDIAALRSRSELVARIRLLEADCVGAIEEGFESAVSQLSLLNPGLNTEGTGYMSQIVDGKIVPPPDSPVVGDDGSGETEL